MLNCDTFIDIYWKQFISLEKEFTDTMKYVSLDKENENTFSAAYSKLLLQIGSEVDIVLKTYCRMIEPTFFGNKIPEYKCLICDNNIEFSVQEVLVTTTGQLLQPWLAWSGYVNEEKKEISQPYWWTAYNKIKHERTETGTIEGITKPYYKFSNQRYVVTALAALYQVLTYMYRRLAIEEKRRIITPLPGSRVFELRGGEWDSVSFFHDIAFYINEDGCLIEETGRITY